MKTYPIALAFVAAFTLAGCGRGPTPEERYLTALAILERESAALDLLTNGRKVAELRAVEGVVKELAGMTTEEFLDQRPDSHETNKIAEHIEMWNRMEAVKLAIHNEPESPAHERYQSLLSADPNYQVYELQFARVERAAAAVKKAESDLPSE